jgi:hypothetical protein
MRQPYLNRCLSQVAEDHGVQFGTCDPFSTDCGASPKIDLAQTRYSSEPVLGDWFP